jgi:DNA-binding FadR family transcriptional regulator
MAVLDAAGQSGWPEPPSTASLARASSPGCWTLRYTPARFLSSDPGWRATMRTDHEALLAAFAAGDPDAARAAMSRRFSDGADRQAKHLDDLGIWREA